VKRSLQIADVDVAVGRIAPLPGPRREGAEYGRKPAFQCGRETTFTVRSEALALAARASSPTSTEGSMAQFRV
jgi:hypothetical protein